MEAPRNKVINTKKAAVAPGGTIADTQVQDYMFPHSPTPVVVQAKDMEEALEKFNSIIKTK